MNALQLFRMWIWPKGEENQDFSPEILAGCYTFWTGALKKSSYLVSTVYLLYVCIVLLLTK